MKVKYDVTGVETQGDFKPVKPGLYRAKIKEINEWSGQHGAGMEVVLGVESDSAGKKKGVEGIGSQLWTYIYFSYEPTAFKFAEFLVAVGLADEKKRKGTLDTAKLIGNEVLVRVKADKDRDTDEYRPRVGKLLPPTDDPDEDEAEDEEEPDDAEGEEPEEDEEDDGEEAESEDEDDEGVDLDTLNRTELKAFIKEEELEVTVKKSMSDDDIRAAIIEAMGEDDEEEPEEDEEPEEEDEDDGLDDLDRTALKKKIKAEGLDVTVKKSMSDDDIRAAIRALSSEEPEDEADGDAPDYDSWEAEQLKAELKERGLTLEGRFAKSKAVKALKEDDSSDSDPF